MRLLETGHGSAVHTLCFVPDGLGLLAAQGRSNRVLRWRLDDFTALPSVPTQANRVVCIACSETLVAIASASGGIWAWEHDTAGRIAFHTALLRNESGPFPFLRFSPDGRSLFCTLGQSPSAATDWSSPIRPVRIDPRTGQASDLRLTPLPWGPPCQADFSPDGSRLAICFRLREAAVHAFPSGERHHRLLHGSKAHMAAYSPNGSTLATASPDGLVRIWDADTGRERAKFTGQAKPLHGISYSPDGRTVATACGLGTVTLWDVASGRARAALDWGIGPVHSVAFSPDGMRAAAGGMGTVAIWDIDDWDV